MNKKVFSLLLLLFCSTALFAQKGRKIAGSVQDSAGNEIVAASVKLVSEVDTLLTQTSSEGTFQFRIKAEKFTITITSLGFETSMQAYYVPENLGQAVLKPIVLKAKVNLLDEVIVKDKMSILIKEDTIEYNAKDFAVRENSVVEDLLRNLPGLEVDQDGNIRAQGEEVVGVRMNGVEFFAGDLKTLTRQFPAELIEKIQIIDDYGEEANLTGIKKGKSAKILNVVIPPEKNKGLLGNVRLGAGTNERYDIGMSANRFDNAQVFSFQGNFNNTSTNSFSTGNRVNEFGDNQLGVATSGISQSGSVGVDFRDKIGKKVDYNGSYSFSNQNNKSISNQLIETLNTFGTIYNNLEIENTNTGRNHRANASLDYKINKSNLIKFSGNFSSGNNQSKGFLSSQQTGLITQDNFSNRNTDYQVPAFGSTFTYNHRFTNEGRNFYFNINLNSTSSDNFQELKDDIRYYSGGAVVKDSVLNRFITSTHERLTGSVNLSYSEPLSKTDAMQVSFSLNTSNTNSARVISVRNRFGFRSIVDSLGTINEQLFLNSRLNLHYVSNRKKLNYSVGMSVLPSRYSAVYLVPDTSIRRNMLNLAPSANLSYNWEGASFSVYYNGQNNQPSINYIQPVRDVTNLQNQVVGNEDLRPEFHHAMTMSYNRYNPNAKSSFFANLSSSFTQNKIVPNIILVSDTLNSLKQETHFLNSDGFYNVGGGYSWSALIKDKVNVSWSGSFQYNNNISYANNIRNVGQNWSVSQSLALRLNTKDWYDVSPGVTYSFSSNDYSLSWRDIDKDISSWIFNVNAQVFLFKQMSLGFDVNKSINSGYALNIQTDPLIINAYFSKSFFADKSATFRFEAFDLLNQGASITRRIINNSIIDDRSNRLTRYFIGSFSMKLNKFWEKKKDDAG